MRSYPTPQGAAHTEAIHPYFLKLHPGSPVHYFTKAEDEHYHGHPWSFRSHVVVGGYREEVLLPNGDGTWRVEVFERLPGTSHDMPAEAIHRLVGLINGPCITRCEYGPEQLKPTVVKLDEMGYAWFRYEDEDKQAWKRLNQ